ncbi:MAG: hypothetical protein CMP05_05600 [Xanthomarina sp.]|uniref:hypothetical protein n=1 Tax=Xanthomarina sp. TaxID=1931211 RepID=UPI000C4032D3|nr:hypothetical protein [Xanthomarina sp.]MAL24073.1 hypothetical protein [Xanthomarina sp.]MBF61457.1 hypothetical protein [Xanthomarina sp.]HAI16681.1 hypothetical protein [Xanthomarina gelatinilytica]
MKHQFLYLFWIVLLSFHVKAQDFSKDQDVKVNQQLWLDYNFKNNIDSLKVLNTQIGFRKISPNVFNRFLVLSHINLLHKKSLGIVNLEKPFIESFMLGAGIIYTQNYDADDNLEFRLSQGFKFSIPTLKGIDLINYVRLEERFQNTFNNSGWTAGYRLRYRISTELNWKKHVVKFTNGLYIPMSF